MKISKLKTSRRGWQLAGVVALAAAGVIAVAVPTGANAASAPPAHNAPGKSNGLGPLSGLLPRDHLTLESALQINLSNETARLPIYPGIAYKGTSHEEKVWYVLLDASDEGAAADLG